MATVMTQEWRKKELEYGETIRKQFGQVFFRYGKVVLPYKEQKTVINGKETSRKINLCTLYNEVKNNLPSIIEAYEAIARENNLRAVVSGPVGCYKIATITLTK